MGVIVAEPSQAPLQDASVVEVVAVILVLSFMVIFSYEVHPFASVTATLYVPEHNPLTEAVVCPPGDHK